MVEERDKVATEVVAEPVTDPVWLAEPVAVRETEPVAEAEAPPINWN